MSLLAWVPGRRVVLPSCLAAGACLFLTAPPDTHATNLLTTNVQASGANWTAAIWKTNNGSGVPTGTAVAPTSGNTYTMIFNGTLVGNGLNNTRLRPPTSGNATFPGDSLTLNTNTELRFKAGSVGNIMTFAGVSGNPGLILNGGMLNGGDDGTYPVRGYIRVTAPSFISHGANGGGGGISANRSVDFQGILDGTNSVEILNAGTTVPQIVSGNSNTFSGQWIVDCGWLQGSGTNSLGTNSILVDPQNNTYLQTMPSATTPTGPAWFEVGYNINSAGTLTLRNGGIMRLHQNCCFASVVIEGTPLSAGTHPYSELAASFPNNFAAGGYGSITVQPYGTPPVVAPQFLAQPLPVTVYAGRTITFFASILGDQVSLQWLKNNNPISDGANIVGSQTASLTISNVSVADVATYSLRASNPGGIATSHPVALALAPGGDAYDSAVVANGASFYYSLNETGDPSTNSPAFDLLGGKTGTYGTAVQNGFNGIVGPRAGDGFPFFSANNGAALFPSFTPNTFITLPPLNLNTNSVTITAWINPAGLTANAGIVFCRAGVGAAQAGLTIAPSGTTLGYNWNDLATTYNFNSAIVPPVGQWSFVGVVITPTNATVFMINSNSFLTSVNSTVNPAVAFSANTLIGDDSYDNNNGSRGFNGSVDDVAIFPSSLSISQMIDLYAAASGVSTFPVDIVTPPQSLSVYYGQAASFSVQVSGPSPTFQWQAAPTGSGGPYTNLVNTAGKVLGATSQTLTILNATNANALDYVVIVSNPSGSTTNSYFSPASLTVQQTGPPETISMACQEASGNDWDINPCWSDGNAASISAAAYPGSTYEILPGALLRTPQNVTYAVFPTTNLASGYLPPLALDGNGIFINNPGVGTPQGQIKFKANLPIGTNFFTKLVLAGGQLDNAGSPSGMWVIQGEVDVATNSIIYVDSSGSTGRPYRLESWLTGSGGLEYYDFDNSFGANLNVTGNSNTFKGTWYVGMGPLLGTGTNSLGTNNITVGVNGDLETTYNINNTNATLFLSGQMLLHQNDTWGQMYVGTTPVPAGTYTYAQLAASYPANFPATWPLLTGSTTNRASGNITVKRSAPPLPVTFAGGLGAPTLAVSSPNTSVGYSVTPSGGTPPFTYQWYLNGSAVAGATSSAYSVTPPAGTNSVYVVVQNGGQPATNGPATLLINTAAPIVTFADTNNWSLQGVGFVPVFSTDASGSNMLTLTTDLINETASAFYKIGQYIGAFKASFTYTPSGSLQADGATFCFQNSTVGAAALGGGGGNLGYVGITNSAALAMNIYSPNIIGIGFASGGGSAPTFMATDPVNIATGDPIQVQLSWAGIIHTNGTNGTSPLQVTLTDATAGTAYSTNLVVGDITALVGDTVAYVGLTAATGGSSAQQDIDNFSFQYVPAPAAGPVTLHVQVVNDNLVLSWSAGTLMQASSITGPWSAVSGAQSPYTVAPTAARAFYRVLVE